MIANEAARAAVLTRVAACLDTCVGAGGHLYGYTVESSTFEVTDTVSSDDGTAYRFRVDGRRDDDFLQAGYADLETIEGTVVLDGDLDLTFDAGGRVRFDPHTVVHPRFWRERPEWARLEAAEPPEDGLLELAVPEVAAAAYNPVWWRPDTRDDLADEVERRLGTWGEAVVLVDQDSERSTPESFEQAMTGVAERLEADHDLAFPSRPFGDVTAVYRQVEEDGP